MLNHELPEDEDTTIIIQDLKVKSFSKKPELSAILKTKDKKIQIDSCQEVKDIIKGIMKDLNIQWDINEYNFSDILENNKDIIEEADNKTLKKILKSIQKSRPLIQWRHLDFINKLEITIQEILENIKDMKLRIKKADKFPFWWEETADNSENILEKQKEHFPQMYEILKNFRETFFLQYIKNKEIDAVLIRKKFLEIFKNDVIDPISQIDNILTINETQYRNSCPNDIRNKFIEIKKLISNATDKQILLWISNNFFFAEVDELLKCLKS